MSPATLDLAAQTTVTPNLSFIQRVPGDDRITFLGITHRTLPSLEHQYHDPEQYQ